MSSSRKAYSHKAGCMRIPRLRTSISRVSLRARRLYGSLCLLRDQFQSPIIIFRLSTRSEPTDLDIGIHGAETFSEVRVVQWNDTGGLTGIFIMGIYDISSNFESGPSTAKCFSPAILRVSADFDSNPGSGLGFIPNHSKDVLAFIGCTGLRVG